MKQFLATGIAVVFAIAITAQVNAQCCGNSGYYSAQVGYAAPAGYATGYTSGWNHGCYTGCGNYCGSNCGHSHCGSYCGTSCCGNYGYRSSAFLPARNRYCGTACYNAPMPCQQSCCGGSYAAGIPAWSGSCCGGGYATGYPVNGYGYSWSGQANPGCPGCVGGQMIMDPNMLQQNNNGEFTPNVDEGTPQNPPTPDDT
jgi:hypothetical protein